MKKADMMNKIIEKTRIAYEEYQEAKLQAALNSELRNVTYAAADRAIDENIYVNRKGAAWYSLITLRDSLGIVDNADITEKAANYARAYWRYVQYGDYPEL